MMDTQVNLKLWVKVEEEWRDSDLYMKITVTIRKTYRLLYMNITFYPCQNAAMLKSNYKLHFNKKSGGGGLGV